MAARQKVQSEVETMAAISKMSREQADLEIAELKEKQAKIAECYKFVGRIQAAEMIGKFGNVSTLMWLKDVKESRIYHDIPGVETWDKFCESLGKSRRLVDEQLLNLETLGAEFLETVSSLRVGYRELKKLRQLTHNGTVTIDAESVVIGEERIPLDSDHREDLQAAIERIIDAQARLQEEFSSQKKADRRVQEANHKEIVKLQKENDKLTKEARRKNISPEEDAILGRIEALGVELNGHCLAVENVFDALRDNPFPSAVAAFIGLMDNIRMRTGAFREGAVEHAPSGMLPPEEEWTPPPLRGTASAAVTGAGPRRPGSADCLACRNDCPAECRGACCESCPTACRERQFCRLDDPAEDGLVGM